MWAALGKAAVGMAKKKVKKKGAEMAKNIVNKKEKDNSSAIVVREKSTALVAAPGGALVEQDSSIQKPKSGSSPLDRIDSALLDIINTLKSRRKLMLAQSRRDRVQFNKQKKAKREGLLEKMKAGGKKMLGNIKAAASGWWERLQTFLLMTMIGSLVLAIKNNWESIQEKIEKVVKFVQDFWKVMEPVAIPLLEVLKWLSVKGFELVKPLFDKGKEYEEIMQGTDEVSEGLKKIDAEKSKLTGLFDKSKSDTEKLQDEDYSVDFSDIEALESETEGITDKADSDLAQAEESMQELTKKVEEIKLDLPAFEKGAVPVPETGPAIVHKGEVIIPAPVVKQVGGPMKIENILNMMQSSELPGLGGGGGGTDAITAKATTKSLGKRGKDIGNLLARPFRDKTKADPRSTFATLSKYIPPVMMEKMEKISSILNDQEIVVNDQEIVEKTFSNNTIAKEMKNIISTLNEQTEYEDPSPNTIVIPLPAPPQPSSGGGSEGETKVISIQGDTLNRYMETLIQGALY